MNRTKIVATMGPATESAKMIEKMLRAGVNVFRLNFSHASETHIERAKKIRTVADKLGFNVAILADLQGPKIRIAKFTEGAVTLENGSTFILDMLYDRNAGTSERVGIDYPDLVKDCKVGDLLLLDDGLIKVKVIDSDDSTLTCSVINGGVLKNNKGINLQGGGLSAPALTDKDKADIKIVSEIQADFVAVSFVREANDIVLTRQLLKAAGCTAHIVAKIERTEAINDADNLDAIIRASDVLMVARGDLGVEVGDAELVGIQKMLIRRSRELNKVVITATQMMESMISNPIPTRAEVMDVANAVLDGTDAVMLSAETAVGKYPVETVEAMGRIIAGAEKHPNTRQIKERLEIHVDKVDESIALSAMFTANRLHNVRAIICLTSSGNTPLLMSRINSQHTIFAFSSSLPAQRRMALYRNVQSLQLAANSDNQLRYQQAVVELKKRQLVNTNDYVIVTYGDISGTVGGSNNMKILKVLS